MVRSQARFQFVATGENGHLPIALDAHRHFRTDQTQTLRAHVAAEQAHSGNVNFGFWRACDHRAQRIADNDIADAYRCAAALGPLDLRAADFDVMAAAEILFDGRSEPRRHEVKLDWPTCQPPPQRQTSDDQDGGESAEPNRGAPKQRHVTR